MLHFEKKNTATCAYGLHVPNKDVFADSALSNIRELAVSKHVFLSNQLQSTACLCA